MPELPEVETTKRGIEPALKGQVVKKVVIHQPKLRWPIPPALHNKLKGKAVTRVLRRAKYLILEFSTASTVSTISVASEPSFVIIHLGMSGSLNVAATDSPVRKHDHAEFHFNNGQVLRYHDPRRFGCILWTAQPAEEHSLLQSLGIEPLSRVFNAPYLFKQARTKKCAVKAFLMDQKVVVGVGNIYANEALYASGVHPQRPANGVSLESYERLVVAVKQILKQAIRRGGTTLKDFVSPEGSRGYFSLELQVYGRHHTPCYACKKLIQLTKIGQRSTYFCPQCQN